MNEPTSSAAPSTGLNLERAARLAAEEESLERKLLRVRLIAVLANAMLVVSAIVYVVVLVGAVAVGGDLAMAAVFGCTLLQAAIVVPCVWARRWPERIRKRMDDLLASPR